jgi:Flagellar biosynthesis protein, FliO
VRLARLAPSPAELLVPLGAAVLMLLVLGPTPRGAAGGLLVAAALLAIRLRSSPDRPAADPPPIRVIERCQLGSRVTLALVETGGRRYLVVAGASVTPLPLEEPQ